MIKLPLVCNLCFTFFFFFGPFSSLPGFPASLLNPLPGFPFGLAAPGGSC